MGEREDAIIETKLDILIKDFQRFRQAQNDINKQQIAHAADEDKVQASILTTLKWHTAIGGFMMVVIVVLVKIAIG